MQTQGQKTFITKNAMMGKENKYYMLKGGIEVNELFLCIELVLRAFELG